MGLQNLKTTVYLKVRNIFNKKKQKDTSQHEISPIYSGLHTATILLSSTVCSAMAGPGKKETLTIAVIMSTVREVRQGPKVATQVVKQLEKAGIKTILIDPATYELPLLDKRLVDYPKGKIPENLVKLAKLLEGADGYVLVSGIYNWGVPAALKNLLDHFQRPQF